MQRETMEYDVVVVGAGPAGLAAAIRLKQLASAAGAELSVCLVEKGAEIGAHILSGAVIDPRALAELFPDWNGMGAPLAPAVERDEFYFLRSSTAAVKVPNALVPASMHNDGSYIVSLGNVCRWLGTQAEALGVEIFPGFAAAAVQFDARGAVTGVITGDMGRNRAGDHKAGYEPGVVLRARQTVFAEGSRGHLGKQLIARFGLDLGVDPQHYGIGLKELWEVDAGVHSPGLVVHGSGWPLTEGKGAAPSGGFFLYHLEARLVSVGLIVDLNYANPWLSPFDEFQRMKHHPLFAGVLQNGQRIAYGARAITKGGINSLPKMTMPGALLVGCNAGTLNFARIKGTHTAMKSGMVAAETIFAALKQGIGHGEELTAFRDNFASSWAGDELRRSRSFGSALHRLGIYAGGALNFFDQTLLRGRLPLALHDRTPDHARLKPAGECRRIDYPKPDGILSFDKLSSVYLSGTNHEEDQPCHLTLKDDAVPTALNLPRFAAPEQRYCPAGVYEIVEDDSGPHLQINAQNCVHCKTCDIKDPTQNIVWIAPEGGGGPNYPNM